MIRKLNHRIEVTEIAHPLGRVLVFSIPPRGRGVAVSIEGRYMTRVGEELTTMSVTRLKEIFAEAVLDYSATFNEHASLSDLSNEAIEIYRKLWTRKSGNAALSQRSTQQLLEDAGLIAGDKITIASLILFGTEAALARLLPQAEVIVEYRTTESSIPYHARAEFRQGFFLFHDTLWELIDSRNDLQHFESGLFKYELQSFDEEVIREALLNAVSHRDYRLQGSIFIRQFPSQIQIISPGSLPEGVNTGNIIHKQVSRNRLLAESFARCGLVERSGQGYDTIFRKSILSGKSLPSFKGTDSHQVSLTLHGKVRDESFVRFLEEIGKQDLDFFGVDDLIALDSVAREGKASIDWQSNIQRLLDRGVIERAPNRGSYMLSKKYYPFASHPGVYTRKRGLDRNAHKALLLKHIDTHGFGKLQDFEEVLPHLSRKHIQNLLSEMKANREIYFEGARRGGVWRLEPEN